MTAYAELDALTNFSFLEGASHPGEMVFAAKVAGHAALGVADRNSLAGVVRAHVEAKKQGLKILIGCRLQFTDGAELIVYPRDRAAYGRLCRLLSIGKSGIEATASPPPPEAGEGDQPQAGGGGGGDLSGEGGAAPSTTLRAVPLPRPADGGGEKEARIAKGDCILTFAQAAALGEGMIALAPAPRDIGGGFEARLAAWAHAWPGDLYLAAAPLGLGDDRARLNRLAQIARRTGAPMVATNAALYADPGRRPLQDVLTCIRTGTTIDQAGLRLQANAERHLKTPAEMARLFKGHEAALARTAQIADACPFSLDELRYEYPNEPVPPGLTATQHLRALTREGLKRRFPGGAPRSVIKTACKELRLIAKIRYEPYFLTVHDIVMWARRQEPEILCQGRGSAANSVVCFCLGITSVDPTSQDMLFERFISEERSEPPDIDVDFEHERREQVMQYVYRRYGRHRAAIVATVIHYRPRSAIRDVGKALGLTEDVTGALANTVWGSWGTGIKDDHVGQMGLGKESSRLKLALEMTRELIQFPRHLSQHVGGFVLTEGPLVETVPIGNAAMDDRTFIEWDKDDIDELKIMKVDVLALGMLSAIRKAFDMIEAQEGRRPSLAIKPTDPRVYQMLCQADSLGVFQVESRAQMAMLPRLQPREFYDLVVQVAIVRPGPIQGGMVHPYLKARKERREAEARGETYRVDFPSPAPPHRADEMQGVLGKTLGVPLFQEQAMRVAMVAAEFSGDEANGLRRAMATFRHMGTIHQYETMLVERMVRRGYERDFAEGCFNQIKGFGEYGFPESHAASFGLLVYVSAWIKCFYPEVFAAALLNSQPMGFYAPAQIVRDAQEHEVEVRPPDVNASDWDCTLEAPDPGRPRPPPPRPFAGRSGRRRPALRLGLRQIDGFQKAWAEALTAQRAAGPFVSLDDLRTRAGLPAAALDKLAAADALGSLKLNRREGLWSARGLPRAAPTDLFTAAGLDEADGPPPVALPRASPSQEVVHDYETIRLSLKGHPLTFLREHLSGLGAVTAKAYGDLPDGRRTTVAGVVLVRQRPGKGDVTFITLEDETGVVNVVVWPALFEPHRPVIMGARLMMVRGKVQRAEGVIHFIAESLHDRTADLALLSDAGLLKPQPAPGDAAKSSRPDREPGHRKAGTGRHPRDVRVLPKSRDFH